MARPRSSTDNHASLDRLPDIEPDKDEITLPPARETWRTATKREYAAFCVSTAAHSIRAAEIHLVTRYFDLVDKESALWRDYEATSNARDAHAVLQNAQVIHRMVISLGREIGVSPLSRRNLGVASTNVRPGSRLDAFRRDNEMPTDPVPGDLVVT